MSLFTKYLGEIKHEINQAWDNELIPLISEYIRIPNKSPEYDPNWEKNGYMHKAMDLIHTWVKQQPIQGMQTEVLQLPGRTPLLFIDIPGSGQETVLLYGHMDKQPEMSGWDEGKGPWQPVLENEKLYGRGGADDGYAVFASITAIKILQQYKISHARCVVIIEGCEESGSFDLPFYLEKLEDRIQTPNFVICLDSLAGNYQQLWSTTSLRGMISGKLEIAVIKDGLHSGIGSGVVPSVEIILRQLLDRIEDAKTGQMIIPALQAIIPPLRVQQAQHAAAILKNDFIPSYSFVGKTQPIESNITNLILNKSWRAQLSITGIDGYPRLQDAGNVTLPKATFKLSVRIPPTVKSAKTSVLLKEILERDPPFGAQVTFTPTERATGWHAPELAPWLETANELASQRFYAKPAAYLGEGGLIPFMGMLGKKFPHAQFLITGVLGPYANAHGPNEFLHIPMVKSITGSVASVLASHHDHFNQ